MQEQVTNEDKRAMRSSGRLAIWTAIWIGSLAFASFGPPLWGRDPVITWIAVGLNLALGIVWILEHARFLRAVGDLQRKVVLDATALALGAGLVGGFAYAVAEQSALVSVDSEIALLAVLMSVVYIVAVAVGNLRYR